MDIKREGASQVKACRSGGRAQLIAGLWLLLREAPLPLAGHSLRHGDDTFSLTAPEGKGPGPPRVRVLLSVVTLAYICIPYANQAIYF